MPWSSLLSNQRRRRQLHKRHEGIQEIRCVALPCWQYQGEFELDPLMSDSHVGLRLHHALDDGSSIAYPVCSIRVFLRIVSKFLPGGGGSNLVRQLIVAVGESCDGQGLSKFVG